MTGIAPIDLTDPEQARTMIINVASASGMIAHETPPMVGQATAKAGVIGMTRQLALEGARHGIRAVAISPGPFLTPAADRDLGDHQAARDALTRKTLLTRFGQPEEIAELAAFLASDRASYITGANYPVDGARPLGRSHRHGVSARRCPDRHHQTHTGLGREVGRRREAEHQESLEQTLAIGNSDPYRELNPPAWRTATQPPAELKGGLNHGSHIR